MAGKKFESEIQLVCICEFDLRGRSASGYLLKDRDNNYCVRFGFTTEGTHPFLSQTKMELNMESWHKGIVGFPLGETLRIHMRSRPDYTERVMQLEALADRTNLPTLQLLDYAEQRQTKNLTLFGTRRSYEIDLFATYTYAPGKSAEQDNLERILGWLGNKYDTLKGQRKAKIKSALAEILLQAFTEGFLHWEEQLNTRMGLRIVPMSPYRSYNYAYKEFNSTAAAQIPHLLILKEVDGQIQLEEIINSELSCASNLVLGDKGLPSIPKDDYRWIHVNNQFVAAVVLDRKLDGYADLEHKYSFLWQPFTQIHNIELVCEYQLSNATIDRINLQRMVRYQTHQMEKAEQHGTVDVMAGMQIESGTEAQKRMLKGERPVLMSMVFFVYRNSPKELNEACQKLINIFPEGKLVRDVDIPSELWINKQPFAWRPLLKGQRRKGYLSGDIPLPLVCTQSLDDQGLELIAKDSGKSVFVNFVTQHRGMLTIAKSRKGKSTLAAQKIKTALDHGVPTIVLDYGMVDFTTTYTDLANSLGDAGQNIEVAYTSHNLLETPGLKQFSSEDRGKHMATFRGFIVSALETLIMGGERGTRFAKRVKSLLNYTIDSFFLDPEIDNRYKRAHEEGFGTAAWKKMPTLHDLVAFIRQLDLTEIGGESTAGEARNETLLQLVTWLRSPVGRSISRPSEIRLDSPFLSFSLRGARDDDEATICALSAQSIALVRALEHPKSFVIVDEGSLLFKNNGLVHVVAEMVVNGGKSGITVDVITQDIATIANSVAGPQFLTNLGVRLIGAIEDSDIKDLALHLKKEPEVFQPNAQRNFEPDNIQLCSHWLLLAGDLQTQVSHFPSPELMGLVATHPPEQAARQRYIAHYGNPLEAITPFGQDYAKARRSGESMDNLFPEKGVQSQDPLKPNFNSISGHQTTQTEQNRDLVGV